MPMKQSGRKIYKSANGKNVDLDLLIKRNELTPAVGNARVNARGDELGPGGKIVRKREDILKDYYNNSAGMVDETVKRSSKTEQSVTGASAAEVAEWEEDEHGNYIRRQG
tara:strand:+ start:3071 stop:3400 length:330 start_codon:yes stop_codon:yes gene_type:complete